MADHTYKISEVPKGKRFEYFMEYYKLHVIFALAALLIAGSFIKSIFFTPKSDISIMAAAEKYVSDDTWQEINEIVESCGKDLNGDGKFVFDFSVNIVDESQKDTDPSYYTASSQKLVATLASGDYIIKITDEKMFDYLDGERLIATYGDLSDFASFDNSPDEKIKIPLKSVSAFKNLDIDDGFYLTLRSRDSLRVDGNKKREQKYKNNAEFFAYLTGLQKTQAPDK